MQLKEIAADGTTSEMLREIGTPQIVSWEALNFGLTPRSQISISPVHGLIFETVDVDGALRCD
jgi:hypothetical protein